MVTNLSLTASAIRCGGAFFSTFIALSVSQPATFSPLIWSIWSPKRKPAKEEGEPAWTNETNKPYSIKFNSWIRIVHFTLEMIYSRRDNFYIQVCTKPTKVSPNWPAICKQGSKSAERPSPVRPIGHQYAESLIGVVLLTAVTQLAPTTDITPKLWQHVIQ